VSGTDWINLPDQPANATTYTDTTVSSGSVYRYRIRACIDIGCSAYRYGTIQTLPLREFGRPRPCDAVVPAEDSTRDPSHLTDREDTMRAPRTRRLLRTLGPMAALPLALACGGGQEQAESPPAEAPAAPAESAEITALRTKFDPFKDFASAEAAGYGKAITPCWFHRDSGGQGIHYANEALIDSIVSPMEPELVMYEPQQDGRLDLLAVEYIVPFAQWKSEAPPTVLGQSFHRNEPLGLWVHHAWLWRDNPSGVHSDWNPNVSCQHAAESEDRADAR
jgi:hypothetical protein